MAVDLYTWAFGAHVTILPFSLVGFYKYSDRTGLFSKAIGDTDSLLARMRTKVAAAFEDRLSVVFTRSEAEPRIVTPDDYSERSVNPLGSDEFRQALGEVIDGDVDVLMDYMKTSRAKKRWCSWARTLSWTVLILALWQVFCVAGFGLGAKLFGLTFQDCILEWSFGPTALLVSLFFICHGVMLMQHDVIQDSKSQYHEL